MEITLQNKIQEAVLQQLGNRDSEMTLKCLGGRDVMSAEVSDHHPIVHGNVLFWNIMMRCRVRQSHGFQNEMASDKKDYNNGFAKVETEVAYLQRLDQIGSVIAELVAQDPTISAITLCEAPVEEAHVKALSESLCRSPAMARFLRDDSSLGPFYSPRSMEGPNWGLLMLVDQRFRVEAVCDKDLFSFKGLTNRFQRWKLTHNSKELQLALTHLPFSRGDQGQALGDEHVSEKNRLSKQTQLYVQALNALLQQCAGQDLIVCGDFNFNPYLLSDPQDRGMDRIPSHNSLVLDAQSQLKTVTVDGILFSRQLKQKHHHALAGGCLFYQLNREHALMSTAESSELDA